MLVLTRKINERIIIDDGRIVVTVTSIHRGPGGEPRARLGIDAPPGCRVDREEVHRSRLQAGDAGGGG